MLRTGIVQKLLEEKWKTFGYVKFTRSLMTTLVYLITLSVVVFLRPKRRGLFSCDQADSGADDDGDADGSDSGKDDSSVRFWVSGVKLQEHQQ